jgi:DedD protein
MANNDVQLDLKKRSRRRLVGAVALALAAAIILPMVMDREPKPSSNELQIRIPGQEGSNFASRLITGTAPPPVSPTLPVPHSALSTQSAPVAPSSAPTAQSHPVAGKVVTPTPQSAPTSHSEPSTSKVPVSPKPEKESQRARGILEGKADTTKMDAKETAGAKFYVQLGVFRDEANAREVLNRAGAVGVKAGALKVEDKTRLRAGPYVDRAAAEAIVTRLKKAGLNGIVAGK